MALVSRLVRVVHMSLQWPLAAARLNPLCRRAAPLQTFASSSRGPAVHTPTHLPRKRSEPVIKGKPREILATLRNALGARGGLTHPIAAFLHLVEHVKGNAAARAAVIDDETFVRL